MSDFMSPDTRPVNTTGGEELFRVILEDYATKLHRNVDKALSQYGMTLYHSLPVDQRTWLGEQLGLNPPNARTRYNLGVVEASRENWDQAITLFQEALDKDASLLEARYNLALACDRKGDKDEARRHFQTLIDSVGARADWAEDVARIRSYLQETEVG